MEMLVVLEKVTPHFSGGRAWRNHCKTHTHIVYNPTYACITLFGIACVCVCTNFIHLPLVSGSAGVEVRTVGRASPLPPPPPHIMEYLWHASKSRSGFGRQATVAG